MSLQIEVASKAEDSLARQFRWYTEHGGIDVAESYLATFRVTSKKLSLNPALGVRPGFKRRKLEGIYFLTFDRPFEVHLIYYRFDETTMRIEYVIHGARDLPRHLREENAVYAALPIKSSEAVVTQS